MLPGLLGLATVQHGRGLGLGLVPGLLEPGPEQPVLELAPVLELGQLGLAPELGQPVPVPVLAPLGPVLELVQPVLGPPFACSS